MIYLIIANAVVAAAFIAFAVWAIRKIQWLRTSVKLAHGDLLKIAKAVRHTSPRSDSQFD